MSKAWSVETFSLTAKGWYGGELAPHVGTEVFLQFADEGTGAWEHITLDNIAVWPTLNPPTLNPPKSTVEPIEQWTFEDGTLQGFEKDFGDCGTIPQRYGDGQPAPKPAGGGNYHINTYDRAPQPTPGGCD